MIEWRGKVVGLSFACACASASACVRRGAMQQASKKGEMMRRRRKALMLCGEPCRPGCVCRGCRGWGEGDASWSSLCALAQLGMNGVTGDARATKSTTSASPRIRRLARGSGRPVVVREMNSGRAMIAHHESGASTKTGRPVGSCRAPRCMGV